LSFLYRNLPAKEFGKFDHIYQGCNEQESPAVADKPARREGMPKIAQIRRAYNVVADNTGLLFIRLAVVASEIYEIPRNSLKIQTYRVQGHPRSSILVPIESACTFLLVTNSNFGRISYRFRVIDTFSSKIACFPTSPLFDAP